MSTLQLRAARLDGTRLSRHLEQAAPGTLDGLDLAGNPAVAGDLVDLLLASGHLPHLKWLDLSAIPLEGQAFATLVNSPGFSQVEVLLLGGIPRDELDLPFARSGWAAIATCELKDAALLALASSPYTGALRVLELSYVEATDAAWAALRDAAFVPQLTALAMRMVPDVARATLVGLLQRAERLERLALNNCGLGDEGVLALCRAPCLPTLERLLLPCNGVTRAGVATLMQTAFPRLRVLDLEGVSLDVPTIELLRRRTGPRALKTLVLSHESAVTTGQTEVWYDQGAAVGESAEVLRLWEVQKRFFADDTVSLTSGPSPWPRGWLA